MGTTTGGGGLRPYILMLCGCFWFSLMALQTHILGTLCDWQIAALARSGLATVFALAIALSTGARLVVFHPRVLWVRSVAGSCSMVATFYALTHMPVSDVLTITNTFPMWVALLSWPLVGEKPTAGVWAAVACAVVGVAVTQQAGLFTRPAGAELALPPADPLAPWCALAASGFTAVAMLGLNRLKGVSSLGVVVHFSAVSTLFCFGAMVVFPGGPGTDRVTEPTTLGLLLGVGGTATIGQVFLTLAFRSGTATKVAVVNLTQVVMVMAVDVYMEWKQLDAVTLAGTALVLGPTGWLMARERKAVPPPDEDTPPAEEVAIE